jgi:hypothetical protein
MNDDEMSRDEKVNLQNRGLLPYAPPKVLIKVGRKEGLVSSYNLFFEDGSRLKTDDLLWVGAAEREAIAENFLKLVQTLQAAGWKVEGDIA